MGLNNDPYPSINVLAGILLSNSDLNLVPRGLINGELVWINYSAYSIHGILAPDQINMLLELAQREETILPELTLDEDY